MHTAATTSATTRVLSASLARARRRLRAMGIAVAATIGVAGVVHADPPSHDGLAVARRATAPFHRLDAAMAAGYTTVVLDVAGHDCIAEPGVGAMGIHYLDGALLDDAVAADAPEVLVYEPDRHGSLHLVALEYLVFQDAWDASHSSPPSLFGQRFSLTGTPNRYGVPPYYSLHAWLWRHNPADMFAMWNPGVTCPAS
jgi:hypothetical protein